MRTKYALMRNINRLEKKGVNLPKIVVRGFSSEKSQIISHTVVLIDFHIQRVAVIWLFKWLCTKAIVIYIIE